MANPLHKAAAAARANGNDNGHGSSASPFEVEGGAAVANPHLVGNAVPILSTPPRSRRATMQQQQQPSAESSSGETNPAEVPTVEEIFSEIDADGSGEVVLSELTTWWTTHGGDEVSRPHVILIIFTQFSPHPHHPHLVLASSYHRVYYRSWRRRLVSWSKGIVLQGCLWMNLKR